MLSSQRALFDIPREVCYLNAASWSPLPLATQEAGRAGVARKGRPWTIEPNFPGQQYDRARRAAARLINADPNDVALIPSVSWVLRPVSWERALEVAAGLSRHRGRVGALVGGQATNEEGFLLARMLREGLGSPHMDSRRAGALPVELHRALGAPPLQARTSDLEFAHQIGKQLHKDRPMHRSALDLQGA